MAELLQDGSIRMRNGRILWGKDVVQIIDVCELGELLCPSSKAVAGFQGFGGGGRGSKGDTGPVGPRGLPGIISLIQDEGFNLPLQNTLNFIGDGVSVVNDPGNGRLNITIRDLFAATRIVSLIPGDGTDLTIQDAIDNLPAAGGMIFVKQGTYPISASIILPDKPVAIVGAGDGTILDIGANAISVFTQNFDHAYQWHSMQIKGNGSVGQVLWNLTVMTSYLSLSMFENLHTGIVPGTEIEGILKGSVTAGQAIFIQNCDFSLPDTATSYLADTYNTTIVCSRVLCRCETTFGGTNNPRGGIKNNSTDLAASDSSIIGLANFANIMNLSCEFSELQGFGNVLNFKSFSRVVGCAINDLILTSDGTQIEITGNVFGPIVGSVARIIDMAAGASYWTITGNSFAGYSSEAIRLAGVRAVVGQNNACKITEIGAADFNRYDNNEGFAGSTIIGPSSLVENENYRNVVTWGADASGVADSTAAFQAAINALPAAGGVVFLPPGSYKVTAKLSLVDKNVIFMGSGLGSVIKLGTSAITLFEAPNGLTDTRRYAFENLRVTGNDGTNQTFFVNLDTNGRAWVLCRDCKIGGNNTDGLGIKTIFDYQAYDTSYTRDSLVLLENCDITPPTAAGATLIKTSNPAGTFAGAVNLTAIDCRFVDDSGDLYKPWIIDLDGDVQMTRCMIRLATGACDGLGLLDSYIQCGLDGAIFTSYGTAWVVAGSIAGCYSVGVGNVGVFVLADTYNTYACAGNQFIYFGVEVTGHGSMVTGNRFINGSVRSVYLNGATRCTITGNVFENTNGYKTIEEAGGADFNAISGNNGTASGGGLALAGVATIAFEAGKNMA